MKKYNIIIIIILTVFTFFSSACKKESDTITITAPTNENYVAPGSFYTITWDGNLTGLVNIKLYNGTDFRLLIDNVTATTGSYTWQVPSYITEDFYYRVLVESATNGQVYDYSEYFYISSTGGSGNCDDITISIPGNSVSNNYWYTNRHIPIRWTGGSGCIVDVYYANENGDMNLFEASVDLGSGVGSENYYILSSSYIDTPTDENYNSHLEFYVAGTSVASSETFLVNYGIGSFSFPSYQSTLYYGNSYTISWSGGASPYVYDAILYKNGSYERRISFSFYDDFEWVVDESNNSNDFYYIVIETDNGYYGETVAVSDIFFIDQVL